MDIAGLRFIFKDDICANYIKSAKDLEKMNKFVSYLFGSYRLDSILLKIHNESLSDNYKEYPVSFFVEMAKYAILNSTIYGEISVISDEEFRELLRITAEIVTHDVEFLEDINIRPQEAAASFILRAVGRQVRWDIYINNMIMFYRTIFLFDELITIQDAPKFIKYLVDNKFKERFGLPLLDFITMGFILFAGSNKIGGMRRSYFDQFREKGIKLPSDADLRNFLNQVITDSEQFRSDPDLKKLNLNPLLKYPLIRIWKDSALEDPYDDKFIAPIPSLIIYKFSTGIYYQLRTEFGERFTTAFGELFELYIGKLLEWYNLPGKILSGKDIRSYCRDKLHYTGKIPDWVILEDKGIILIECKATYYSQDMYENGVDATIKTCIDHIRKANEQFNEFEEIIPNLCNLSGVVYDNQPVQKAIVTFEPLLGLKWGPLRDMINEGKNKDWKILWVWELEIIQPYIAKGADFWSFLIEYDHMTFHDMDKIVTKMKLQTGADHEENRLLEYGERVFGKLISIEGHAPLWLD